MLLFVFLQLEGNRGMHSEPAVPTQENNKAVICRGKTQTSVTQMAAEKADSRHEGKLFRDWNN
jgi:hypothetical protein